MIDYLITLKWRDMIGYSFYERNFILLQSIMSSYLNLFKMFRTIKFWWKNKLQPAF